MATDGIAQPQRARAGWASRRQFLKVWNSAPTITETAAQLGVTIKSAQLRSYYLRKCGVELKRFPTGRKPKPKPQPQPQLQPKPGRKPDPPARPPRGSAKFAAIWNAATSVRQAAHRLRLTTRPASARAYYLRTRGVELKRFPSGTRPKRKAEQKPQPRRQRKPRRSATEFAAVWNAAASVRQAAEQMGLTPRSAATMASAYRREGLELKLFTPPDWRAKAAEFVAAWNASTTAEEAAERLGMPPAIARVRANRFRGRGISLKQLPGAVVIRRNECKDRFAAQWNAARSVAEVSAALGVSHKAAQNRASRLRKRGVPLKAFSPGPQPADQRFAGNSRRA